MNVHGSMYEGGDQCNRMLGRPVDKSEPRTARDTVALALSVRRILSRIFLSLRAFSAARVRGRRAEQSRLGVRLHELDCVVVRPEPLRCGSLLICMVTVLTQRHWISSRGRASSPSASCNRDAAGR